MHFYGLLETDSILAFLLKLFDSNDEILSQIGCAGVFIAAKKYLSNYIT